MTLLFETVAGSRLYGLATASSDTDLKAVRLPAPREILLGDIQQTRQDADPSAGWERTTFTLDRFIHLVTQGQIMALELLFVPDEYLTRTPAPYWLMLRSDREKLFTRNCEKTLNYARQQASRYALRQDRLIALREVVDILREARDAKGGEARLTDIFDDPRLAALMARHPFVSFVEIPNPGGHVTTHLEVCQKRLPAMSRLAEAQAVWGRQLDQYGERLKAAQKGSGVDWKSLSHAIRVATEMIEFLETGTITLPLRNADRLRAIKAGDADHDAVSAEIEELLDQLTNAASRTDLPENPDESFIEEFIMEAHREVILNDG